MQSLRRVVNSEVWPVFMDYIDLLIDTENKRVMSLSEPHEIYRSQGKLSNLYALKNLKEQTNRDD
jgi:hypothetical protein